MDTASEWKELELGECADILAGFPFRSEGFTENEGDVRLLRGVNIANGRVHWEDCKRWHMTGSEELGPYSLAPGDVVLAMDGMIVGGLTRVACVSNDDLPSLLVQRVARFRVKSELDQRFLSYLLSTKEFRDHLWGVQTGTTISHVSVKQIAGFKFRSPPVAEQRSIARVLGSLDDKIELNRRMIQTLEQIAQALFKSWFVDFDPVHAKAGGRWKMGESLPGMPADTWDLWPSEFEESEVGEIPKGWAAVKFSDLATSIRETLDPQRQPSVIFDHYSIPAFDEGQLPKGERGSEIQSQKLRVPNESILVSRLNPSTPRVWPVTRSDERVGLASTEFLVLLPRVPMTLPFLWGVCTSSFFGEMLAGLVTGTTGSRQRVHPLDAMAIRVIGPSAELISRFDRTVRPLMVSVDHNRRLLASIASTRNALLPKLLSGEIRVPVNGGK